MKDNVITVNNTNEYLLNEKRRKRGKICVDQEEVELEI